jgi:hypothetical protein
MVPRSKTPVLLPTKLHEVGYDLVFYPVTLLFSPITAPQATLKVPRPIRNAAPPPAVFFPGLQSIVGFSDCWSRETECQM